jgi:hypothetical protein
MKLIELYKEWMETGVMPDSGLCPSIPTKYKIYLNLFKPEPSENILLMQENLSVGYWASGLDVYDNGKYDSFTDLRQTIVLLICAMNDEI